MKISKNLIEAHRVKIPYFVRHPVGLTEKQKQLYNDKLARLLAAESCKGKPAKIPHLMYKLVMEAKIE